MSKFDVTISGIADVNNLLRQIAPREAKNLLSTTTVQIARDLATNTRPLVPKDASTPENLADDIVGQRDRGTRTTVAASVRVRNIRRNFFWKFLERGQGPDRVEHAFFLRAFHALRANIDQEYVRVVGDKLVKRLNRLKKRGG